MVEGMLWLLGWTTTVSSGHLIFNYQLCNKILALSKACLLVKEGRMCISIF